MQNQNLNQILVDRYVLLNNSKQIYSDFKWSICMRCSTILELNDFMYTY